MSGTEHVALQMDKLTVRQMDTAEKVHNDETDATNHLQKPARLAVSELDDDDSDGRPFITGDVNPGVDDGLLDIDVNTRNGNGGAGHIPNGGRRPSYAFPGYNGPSFVNINGVETPIPDVNAYQHKKTLAQGMMDLALLSANANQLRYVLETNQRHPYFYPSVIFISLSIVFQIAVGVGLIWNGRYNIKKEEDICRANKINNYTVIGIFIVTVVNVLISAFGVADGTPAPAA